jgi:hypothetical protein
MAEKPKKKRGLAAVSFWDCREIAARGGKGGAFARAVI